MVKCVDSGKTSSDEEKNSEPKQPDNVERAKSTVPGNRCEKQPLKLPDKKLNTANIDLQKKFMKRKFKLQRIGKRDRSGIKLQSEGKSPDIKTVASTSSTSKLTKDEEVGFPLLICHTLKLQPAKISKEESKSKPGVSKKPRVLSPKAIVSPKLGSKPKINPKLLKMYFNAKPSASKHQRKVHSPLPGDHAKFDIPSTKFRPFSP